METVEGGRRLSFVRQVAMLAGGTALGQGLVVAASPILTRLYTPHDFGVYAVALSLWTILTAVATLRYEMAIPMPADSRRAAALTWLCMAIAVGMTALCAAGITAGGDALARWLGSPQLAAVLPWVPVGLLGAALYQVAHYWVSRAQRFGVLSAIRVVRSVGQVGWQLGWGWVQPGPLGLVLGWVVSQYLGIVALLRRVPLPRSGLRVTLWKEVAGAYRRFPLYTTWASLLTVMGTQLAPVLFTRFFTAEVAGHFSMALRVLVLPSSLLGQAVGQVLYPRLAAQRAGAEADDCRTLERLAAMLLLMAVPVFAFLAVCGRPFFSWVFGQPWALAGTFAQMMAPWLLVSFVSSPLSTYALVRERHRQAFWVTVYETALRLGAIAVGGWMGSSRVAVGLFSAAGVIISVVYLAWMLRLAGSGLGRLVWALRGWMILALVLVGVTEVARWYLEPALAVAMAMAGWSGYAVAAWTVVLRRKGHVW